MLLPPELVALIGVDPAHPGVAEEPQRLVHPDLQHLQLDALDAGGLRGFHGDPSARLGVATSTTRSPASPPPPAIVIVNHSLMAPMLHLARGHSIRESGLFSFPSLSTDLVLAMLGVANGGLLGLEPVADPLRGRSAAADPPLAVGTAAPGGGARRPEDRALQRPPLRRRTERGARASGALRAAALARDGRPRPPARHQQHLRPPRRRRGAAGHRRGLPRAAAPLRRAGRFGGEEFAILLPETAPEQAFEIAERIRRTVAASALRRRDLERADPRDGLDRRRRLPARRSRRERADPPGRPRRLPRQAPGAQPRARRELGAAAHAREAAGPARGRAGGRRPRRPAASGRRARARPRATPSAATRDARSALPLALAAARRLRRRRQRRRRGRRPARRDLRHEHGLDRPRSRSSRSSVRARRSRSRSTTARSPSAPSARSPAPRCSALGQRSRSRSRSPRSSGAPAAVAAPLRALQHRRRCRSRRSRRPASSRAGFDGDARTVGLRGRGHRRRRHATSRSTWACSAWPWRSRATSAGGPSSGSASRGWRRTTSSTASSAA